MFIIGQIVFLVAENKPVVYLGSNPCITRVSDGDEFFDIPNAYINNSILEALMHGTEPIKEFDYGFFNVLPTTRDVLNLTQNAIQSFASKFKIYEEAETGKYKGTRQVAPQGS